MSDRNHKDDKKVPLIWDPEDEGSSTQVINLEDIEEISLNHENE